MTAKGYTTADAVQRELGATLTADQLLDVSDLIAQAEQWIDHETSRAWLAPSPIVGELHTLTSRLVYLDVKPVTGITSVTIRSQAFGASETALVAGTGYELLDAAGGVLAIMPLAQSWWGWDRAPLNRLVKVSYTASTPVPGDIGRACTLLAAHWMLPRLYPERAGIDSYGVAGQLQMKMRPDDVPPEVIRLVRGRSAVVLA